MDDKFFAYFAGYIDGDGHFRFRKYTQSGHECFHCKLMITSTNKEPLQFFQNEVGGTFYAKKHSNPRWKQEYIYTLHIGKDVFCKIKSLERFLIEKRSQFILLRDFFTSNKETKTQICNAAKELRSSMCVTPEALFHINSMRKSIAPTPLDYVYFSGYIDAEGALTVTKKRLKSTDSVSFSCHIRGSSTKYPSLEFISTRFGGCFHLSKRSSENCSDCIQWQITDKSAEPILNRIKPYLIIKRQQCEQLLSLRETFVGKVAPRHKDFISYYNHVTPKRECIYSTVKALNKRGL